MINLSQDTVTSPMPNIVNVMLKEENVLRGTVDDIPTGGPTIAPSLRSLNTSYRKFKTISKRASLATSKVGQLLEATDPLWSDYGIMCLFSEDQPWSVYTFWAKEPANENAENSGSEGNSVLGQRLESPSSNCEDADRKSALEWSLV
jgi:hypothetical protein